MSLERGSSLCDRISELVDRRIRDPDPKGAFINHVWSEVEDDYQKMSDDLATGCKEELKARSIPAAVECRVKSRASIIKSLERREIHRQTRKQGPYLNIRAILRDLHDLVGIRIIVDYLDHMSLTSGFVADTFHKEKDPNIFSANRKVGHSWTSWFGAYECTNHHVSANYQDQNPLSYYNGVIFEIQVTSLPANLYNKIAHPLLYKEEAGDLSQGDEIVVDLTKGLAYCYSLCTYYKRYKLDGKAVDTCEMELMKNASSATEGPEFESSINHLAGRMPGVDTAGMKGKSIPRETLELVLGSLLNNDLSRDIGQCLVDKLRREIQGVGLPRIEVHAFGKARFDSQDVFQSPVCQEGTQTGASNFIHDWVENGKEPLLWICSHAGTGKSTLARTVSRDLTKTGQIAAGYFFRRGDVGRNHIRHVIPTIAAQLVLTIPQYEHYLRESIDACRNTDFENMLLYEQFKVLLKTPLSQVDATHSTKVIIVDALDECVDLPQLDQVMSLLVGLEGLGPIRFRLLVTSRDEDPVRAAIIRHGHEKLLLATTYHFDNISDIESILRVGFQRIRQERSIEQTWPTEEQFREVLQRSTDPSPLFIYATTLLRFLGDGTRIVVPKKRLDSWIERNVGRTFNTRLDEMYTTVFENLDPDLGPGDSENLTENEKESLRIVLGTIALAVEPLSMSSLGGILGLDLDVLELLKSCRAVLYIPDSNDAPILMLHKSFSDFLLRRLPRGTCWFNVDEKHQNELLAQGCIRHLDDSLRSNICHLQDPAMLRIDIHPSIIQRYIPNSLQYASSYWIHHVRQAGHTALVTDMVQSFLFKRFLEWIECMAILGRFDRASSAMEELRANTRSDTDLGRFLYDTYRFLLKHGQIIHETPRQIYGTALMFSPTKSVIRNRFWSSRLPGCHGVRNRPESWDLVLQKLRMSPNHVGVNTIALSSDGRLLASSHYNFSITNLPMFYIQLWQSGTGAHLATIEVSSHIIAMCWTQNERGLIFITDSGTVYNHEFSKDLTTVVGPRAIPLSQDLLVAISPSGVAAVSLSTDPEEPFSGHSNSCQVLIWDAFQGKTIHAWSSIVKASTIAISNDSCQVAFIADNTVKLGNIETEALSDVVKGDSYTALTFSADGKTVFLLENEAVLVISVHDGCYRIAPVPPNIAFEATVAFPDGATIATLCNDELWLWSIQHDNPQQFEDISNSGRSASPDVVLKSSVPIEDFSYAEQIAISPDGRYLVSLWINRLYLWSLPGGRLDRLLRHRDTPPSRWSFEDKVSFSRDGNSILAAYSSAIYVWVLEESESSEIDLFPTSKICYEPSRHFAKEINAIWMNGKRVALVIYDRVEIWNIEDGGHHLHTFETGQPGAIMRVAFAPETELLAVAYAPTVSILSSGHEVARQDITLPCAITGLSFSPDGSILMISGQDEGGSDANDSDDESPIDHAIWTAAVYCGGSLSPHHQSFVSPPTRILPLGHEASKGISGDLQFIYPRDPHLSALHELDERMYSFSTDGMFIKSTWPEEEIYNIQHARRVPTASESLPIICQIHRPEMQTWIQRSSQRVIRIPEHYTQASFGNGGSYVAIIDTRQKIVILEFS